MAATYTADANITVFGNMRVAYGTVDMAGVTQGAVVTGLDRVIFAAACFGSSYTSAALHPKCVANINSAGSAVNGTVYIASCTAGDVLKLFAFGV